MPNSPQDPNRKIDTLKTKDSKIRGNCNLSLEVKFQKLEWRSPLTFPTSQFSIEGYSNPYCFDRNQNRGSVYLCST